MRSLNGRNLFPAFREIKNQRHSLSCMFAVHSNKRTNHPDNPPSAPRSSMAALSQSCASRQSTIVSWRLPACCILRIPGEKAGSPARWCVITRVDVVPLRLSHASLWWWWWWWWGWGNHKPCLDTHGQINVRLTQQKTYVTQTCKKHMMDKERQYKSFEAEIFATCVQTGGKKMLRAWPLAPTTDIFCRLV